MRKRKSQYSSSNNGGRSSVKKKQRDEIQENGTGTPPMDQQNLEYLIESRNIQHAVDMKSIPTELKQSSNKVGSLVSSVEVLSAKLTTHPDVQKNHERLTRAR